MVWDQLVLALSPYLIFVCLIGVTLGILWGAMPGLSTTMAMALLIGLSTGMSQYVAIVFMLGVFTGSVFGGAISAVLINIPGTPDAVPTMQTEQPGLIYFIYITLIIANFLMYGMAIVLVKPCVKLFSLPQTLLMPMILPICILGAYAVNLSYFDVYIMLCAGLIGYTLRRFGFPLAPMVLAIILGPLADENLRRSLFLFEGKSLWSILVDHPIGSVLLVIVLYTFYDGILRHRK